MRLLLKLRWLAVVALTALALLGVGGVLGGRLTTHPRQETAAAAPVAATDRLAETIQRAQDRLRLVPGDYPTWASLGSAYLERARVTADPSYYPKAEGALRKSLQLRPNDNAPALTGLGALANARHDFAGARGLAQQALRLDPYSWNAYGVLADAETQLGRPDSATQAIEHMLDLRPGLAAYARASYDLEQHGRIPDAQNLLRQALNSAVDPADMAFCRYQLGELAWQSGQLDDAEREYAAGLAVDPTYLPLRQGRAKVAAAQGHLDAALTDYAGITRTTPAPAYFIEYAELLRAAGHDADADAQLALADAAQQLFTANGGTDDLTGAWLALARNRPADALAMAQREWNRRQFTDVADILAWMLHANGRDADALQYAKRSAELGASNARYTFHLGMIEAALGQTAEARRDLTSALAINPYFSPVDAPLANRTLAGLGS
jgi:tetratricopeptide (TPR) repeat protein